MRKVRLWQAEVEWKHRDDGSMLVWQKGALPPYPATLSEKMEHWAQATPEVSWMAERNDSGEWRKLSYAQALSHIRAIGQALLELNLDVERPLLILSANSIAHGLMALAAQYAGIPSAAVAPAYALVGGEFEKLRSVRQQITPGAVFAEDTTAFATAIEAVFSDLPCLGCSGPGISHHWQTLINTRAGSTLDTARAGIGPDTVAKFLFTSGTTGSPKAVIQTQRMLCSNMAMVLDCYRFMQDEAPVFLDWPPWNHVASGNKVFNLAIYTGGTFYIDAGRPTAQHIGQTIRNLREISPTWYFNVPLGYEMLVEAMKKDAGLAASFFRRLKLMMYAGAAMAEHTWHELEQLAVDTVGERVFLSTGLGATETAPFGLFNAVPDAGPGNLGVPSRELLLKLVPNEDKWEARLKGPSITPGYWRDPERTREAFDDEGFYCLGDALRFADPADPAKGFFFDGRVAENFKLRTGTWVAVGALRAAVVNALEGLAREAVIAGEGQEDLAALLVPFYPAIRRIVPESDTLSDQALLEHPVLREKVAALLSRYNASAGGSSLRVPRAMFMLQPLDLDKGEVTDKGSVNQRAVLRCRPELVSALYSEDPQVIHQHRS